MQGHKTVHVHTEPNLRLSPVHPVPIRRELCVRLAPGIVAVGRVGDQIAVSSSRRSRCRRRLALVDMAGSVPFLFFL